jgi:hypothetical protein
MSTSQTLNYYQHVYDGQSSIQEKRNRFNENSFLKRNKLIRDVIIWFFIIFVLPILLIIIFYTIQFTTMKSFSRKINTENYTTLHSFDLHFIKKTQFSSRSVQHFPNKHSNQPMKLYLLNNKDALCNDGTPAGYYIRKSISESKTWIIMLEGGYFCNDIETCTQRQINSPSLTSSASWSEHKKGILLIR